MQDSFNMIKKHFFTLQGFNILSALHVLLNIWDFGEALWSGWCFLNSSWFRWLLDTHEGLKMSTIK